MLRPRVKQPSETRTLDARLRLGAGRAIASIDAVAVTARGLVDEVAALTAVALGSHQDVAQIQVAGGTAGEVYRIAVTVTDDLGDTAEEAVEIHVLALDWNVPDAPAATVYIAPLDYVHRFGLEEAVRLTDEHDLGRVDPLVLRAALVDATAEVDGYLAGRYETPLSPIPHLVIALTADLARERLHATGTVPDAVRERAATSRRQLQQIALGTVVLPGASQRSTGADTPIVEGPKRLFTRDSMAGW
jgi:phage gp36-like protein